MSHWYIYISQVQISDVYVFQLCIAIPKSSTKQKTFSVSLFFVPAPQFSVVI